MTVQQNPDTMISRLGDWFSNLANPGNYLSYSARITPWLAIISVFAFAVGLYWAFFKTPLDEEMGNTVIIMFVHVPAAWIAQMCYALVAVSSFGLLVWRHPLADVSAKAAAPIGAVITFLCLVTGSIWGRPDWGTYWQWDLRMTSVLILFLLYIGLIALRNAIEDETEAGKLTAILALVGITLLPIIQLSVEWQQSSLHQRAGIIRGEVSVDFLIPLFIMMFAYTMLFFFLHLTAMRTEILRRRIQSQRRRYVMQRARAEEEGRD